MRALIAAAAAAFFCVVFVFCWTIASYSDVDSVSKSGPRIIYSINLFIMSHFILKYIIVLSHPRQTMNNEENFVEWREVVVGRVAVVS